MRYCMASQTTTFCDYSACRICWPVSFVPHHTPSDPILQSLHWLPVTQRIIYKVATLTFKTRLIDPPVCTICFIITYQPTHCDHLPPTCYRNQQQLPTYPTGCSPSLLLKPGITYQQLFDLQHHSSFSLTISKCTSSQSPLNSHQPSPVPPTHHYCDEPCHRQQIYYWFIDRLNKYLVCLQCTFCWMNFGKKSWLKKVVKQCHGVIMKHCTYCICSVPNPYHIYVQKELITLEHISHQALNICQKSQKLWQKQYDMVKLVKLLTYLATVAHLWTSIRQFVCAYRRVMVTDVERCHEENYLCLALPVHHHQQDHLWHTVDAYQVTLRTQEDLYILCCKIVTECVIQFDYTRSSAIAEGLRNVLC